jgi:hypothetical protein
METLLGYQNRRRFTTKTKYYQYWVQNDLFDLVLVKTWGSLTSKHGNQQSIPIQFSDLPSYCANIEKIRYSHGYLPSSLGLNFEIDKYS